jgi:sporulation protein YlmC with PRC-barrel domain
MEGASRLWADRGADREAVVLFAKFHSFAVLALAAASLTSGSASGFAAPDTGFVIAQEQTEPAAQAPATADTPAESGETAAPAETNETPAQPSDADGGAKPDDGASGDTQTAPAADDSADVAPAATEAPAATTAEPSAPASSDAQASSIDASQLKIGTAVFGSDGQKIGEVNGVKSDTDGKVQEILVTDGVAAGLNAKVFAVPGDKITGVADGVKLSLSSEEAKQLPVIDNGNG